MAGLQTVTTPVTNTPISSTTFGVPVANNLTVLANPAIAKMLNSTNQSLTNNIVTALTWDTEVYDTVGGHSTTTNTSRYTCQAGYAGYYRVKAAVYWSANATGRRTLALQVNGTAVPGSEDGQAASATVQTNQTDTMLFLNVGDYVEAICWQTSGGALVTNGSGSVAGQSYFELQWLHQ